MKMKLSFSYSWIVSWGGVLLALAPATVMAAQFFVAPDGKDDNPGNRARPFGSFKRAQQAVRTEREAHPAKGVTVVFLAGTYELDGPVEFTAADSGASP